MKKQWLRRKRRKKYLIRITIATLTMFIIAALLMMSVNVMKNINKSFGTFFGFAPAASPIGKPEITEMFLTPNEYSRPETPLVQVNGIVIHYTANPGTDALANRNYFENLSIAKTTSASSHFVIGLDGKIIQCIPFDEISYASNNRNNDTISIECCHPDAAGKFNDKTYHSLIALTSWLCYEYNLKREDILRHYDITKKLCPLYYVEHEDAWETLKDDVMAYKTEDTAENKNTGQE